jgi:hypothetical protein
MIPNGMNNTQDSIAVTILAYNRSIRKQIRKDDDKIKLFRLHIMIVKKKCHASTKKIDMLRKIQSTSITTL